MSQDFLVAKFRQSLLAVFACSAVETASALAAEHSISTGVGASLRCGKAFHVGWAHSDRS